jgi:peptide/nickel transport system substrate-binding protein
MVFAIAQEGASLDPLATYPTGAADGSRLAAVYDVLMWTDPATGTVRPQLADSLVPRDGGRSWTLRLRAGVRFTDGTPLDAEAVRFNWARHQDPSNRSLQLAATTDIASLQVVDPLTLAVQLKRANANFDRIVAGRLGYIVSPTAIQKDPAGIGRHPVGAGPFVLKEWTPGVRQVFVRNPDYWQRDAGLPRLQTVTMTVSPDTGHTLDTIDRGAVDASVLFDPLVVARAAQRKVGVQRIDLNGGAMLIFNTGATPFTNSTARRAVALALNTTEINQRFYGGEGTVARGVFSSTSRVANSQLSAPQGDPAEARALFAQITAGGTKPLRFVLLAPQSPTTVKVAEYMRDTLNTYPGVDVQLQVCDVPTFIQTVRKDAWTWTVALAQQWLDDPEPELYNFLYSASAANTSGYRNPVVDKALDQARQAMDIDSRRDAYTRVQVEVNRDLPFWVYQESLAAAVFKPRVTGMQLFNDGIVMWDRVGMK